MFISVKKSQRLSAYFCARFIQAINTQEFPNDPDGGQRRYQPLR